MSGCLYSGHLFSQEAKHLPLTAQEPGPQSLVFTRVHVLRYLHQHLGGLCTLHISWGGGGGRGEEGDGGGGKENERERDEEEGRERKREELQEERGEGGGKGKR